MREIDISEKEGSQVIYGVDFEIAVWDPRHVRRTCAECGKPLKTKGAQLCAECNCRRVGKARRS